MTDRKDTETGSAAHTGDLARQLAALGTDLADAPSPAERQDPPDHVIELDWRSDRVRDPYRAPDPAMDAADDDLAALMDPPLPRKAFRPRPGPAKMGRERVPVMVVALFGLSAQRLDRAVMQIARRHRAAPGFVPLFLTDRPDTARFRDLGYSFEYFPPELFGGADQSAAFARRFTQIWRKWRGDYLVDFSSAGYLAARIEDPGAYINPPALDRDRYDPRKKAGGTPRSAPTDVIALKAEYRTGGLADEPDSFVLYRILGNDLPPRHQVGQTLTNLRFLLENEPDLPGCEKRWVVNRVVDPEQEAAIIALLNEFGQPHLRIPFVVEEYARTEWDLESFPDDAFFLRGRYGKMNDYDQLRAQAHLRRLKNNYVINNNGARNAALRDGKGRAKWVLPWDGNCFLTAAAWSEITAAVTARPYLKYFTVPMSRTLDNADLLDPEYRPDAEEEPQMLFRRDTEEEFDETFYYGRRPKVELFYRLAIPGNWDSWPDDAWDRPRASRSEDAGATGSAGWVARLYSGQGQLEVGQVVGLRSRGEARINAITDMLDRLDVEALGLVYRPENLTAYDESKVRALAEAEAGSSERYQHDRLLQEADMALQRGPYSVTDKGALPPSGDRQDYYNPAPYWWPNPVTPNGMPFVFRDGLRIPGTRLYEPQSDLYDRTRVQKLFDDSTILCLAWLLTGQAKYVEHAANLVRRWFISDDSKMNPHLLYSQVRSQTPHDQGSKSGLIEFKDLYYFLDAVRLIERSGTLDDAEKVALRSWLSEYLEWLDTSEQGLAEHATQNNHGTCLDLQKASIAAFLGDGARLKQIFRVSRERILEQFKPDGLQPHEMKRTQTAHYCCFNLQSWVNLCNLAEACGERLWHYGAEDGRGLAAAFDWLLPRLAQSNWKYEQIEPFDRARFLPLFYEARARAPNSGATRLTRAAQAKPLFFPHDGIKPFWMLGRDPVEACTSPKWSSLSKALSKLEVAAFGLSVPQEDATPEEPADVRHLDKRLWAGFEDAARADLEAIRDDAATEPKEVNRAARSLARWHFSNGDLDGALANADRLDASGVVARRERDLLLSYCLAATGEPDRAAAILVGALHRFPSDINLMLAMANAGRAAGGEGPDGHIHWINRVFQSAGLGDLVAADGTLCPQKAASPPAGSLSDDPATSVIFSAGPGDGFAVRALTSLRDQNVGNLQIIVADRTGGALGPEFKRLVDEDDRILRLEVPDGTPEYQVRNAALAAATGEYVTVHRADEWAHPDKLRLFLEALDGDVPQVPVSQQVFALEDLTLLAGWYPEFSFLAPNASAMLLSADLLTEMGGWDAVEGNPDVFLKWRIEKSFGADVFRLVAPGVPLSVGFCEVLPQGPTHIDFRHGRPRDQLRRLIRHSKSLAEAAPAAGGAPLLVTAMPPGASPEPDRLDVLFLGDFSEGSPAIREIRAHIERTLPQSPNCGIFHWPAYEDAGNGALHPEIAALLDDGQLHQISADATLPIGRAVLCHTHLLHQPVKGIPDLGSATVEVLGGPEFIEVEFFDGVRQILPTTVEIEAILQRPVTWLSL